MTSEMTLEEMFTAPAAFAVTTATPTQRAICRVLEGRSLGRLALDEDVRTAMGGIAAAGRLVVGARPRKAVILSGIRTGKSLLAAAVAVHASQTCTVGKLGPGETPRVSVVSLTMDLARVVFDHLVGNVRARPALRALLVEEPTADSIVLRHPSGRPIEIKVVAGAKAGASLVARWSAGAIFDEAPRMNGADDGVVNLEDAERGVLGRLLEGAQVIEIGSPWAPFGPVYDAVEEHWGKPSRHVVIVRASGPTMNPVYWTPERCADLRDSAPAVYQTDVLGEFADPASTMFASDMLRAATRKEPLEVPPEPGIFAAAMDAATRGNAWTLVIVRRDEERRIVVLARQWKPSRFFALDPEKVIGEIKALCKSYGVTTVRSDQWSVDAIKALARQVDLHVDDTSTTAAHKVELYGSLATYFAQGLIELAPEPDLFSDLASVRRRVTQQGIAIELPRTSDGRHSDFAPALALAVEAVGAVLSAEDCRIFGRVTSERNGGGQSRDILSEPTGRGIGRRR